MEREEQKQEQEVGDGLGINKKERRGSIKMTELVEKMRNAITEFEKVNLCPKDEKWLGSFEWLSRGREIRNLALDILFAIQEEERQSGDRTGLSSSLEEKRDVRVLLGALNVIMRKEGGVYSLDTGAPSGVCRTETFPEPPPDVTAVKMIGGYIVGKIEGAVSGVELSSRMFRGVGSPDFVLGGTSREDEDRRSAEIAERIILAARVAATAERKKIEKELKNKR